MTKLKPVTEGMNKFCGPAVLSILTGKSTDECARVISQINGHYRVTGVQLADLLMAANKLGFDNRLSVASGSLYRSLTQLVHTDGMYIVTLPTHFVCIEVIDKKIYFCDNHTKEPITAASSARLQQQVMAIHQVIERPKPVEPVKTPLELAREHLEKDRTDFVKAVQEACVDTVLHAKDLSKAIGGMISYEEAIVDVIRLFAERVRK